MTAVRTSERTSERATGRAAGRATGRARTRPAGRPGPNGDDRSATTVRSGGTADLRRNRARTVLVAVAGAVVLGVFGVLLVHVRLTQSAFELKAAQETLQQRRELHNKLKVTVANLEAPERVRREARRLGMIDPRIVHYVYSDQLTTGAVAAAPTDRSQEEVAGTDGVDDDNAPDTPTDG